MIYEQEGKEEKDRDHTFLHYDMICGETDVEITM